MLRTIFPSITPTLLTLLGLKTPLMIYNGVALFQELVLGVPVNVKL